MRKHGRLHTATISIIDLYIEAEIRMHVRRQREWNLCVLEAALNVFTSVRWLIRRREEPIMRFNLALRTNFILYTRRDSIHVDYTFLIAQFSKLNVKKSRYN